MKTRYVPVCVAVTSVCGCGVSPGYTRLVSSTIGPCLSCSCIWISGDFILTAAGIHRLCVPTLLKLAMTKVNELLSTE